MTTFADLIVRIEAAEVGSAEIDGRVWCWLNGKEFVSGDDISVMPARVSVWYTEPPKRRGQAARPSAFAWSRSIDLVVALIGARLPGRLWMVDALPTKTGIRYRAESGPGYAVAKTPATALLSAALKAIEASK